MPTGKPPVRLVKQGHPEGDVMQAPMLFRASHATERPPGLGLLARAAVAAALALALAAPLPADTVTTKSGETFKGTIVEETAEHVVLESIAGKMTIPRATIETIDKTGAAPPASGPADPKTPPPQIIPANVPPEKAQEALEEAKAALVAGDWVKAGGLLEGLIRLDDKAFGAKDREGATGALITCYLQIKDARGAARAIGRRASLAQDANDKRRLLAAAEALNELNTVTINGKTLTRFGEVIEATMPWKADQCLKQAMETAQKATNLNKSDQMKKAADLALKQLAEANVYMPGFGNAHQAEVLEALVKNVLDAAQAAADHCEKVRPELTKHRLSSIVSRAAALQWNGVARTYLGNRQAAEDGLKNIEPFATHYKAPALYASHKGEIDKLLAALHDYEYYPAGTSFGPYSYYSSNERVKITLRVVG